MAPIENNQWEGLYEYGVIISAFGRAGNFWIDGAIFVSKSARFFLHQLAWDCAWLKNNAIYWQIFKSIYVVKQKADRRWDNNTNKTSARKSKSAKKWAALTNHDQWSPREIFYECVIAPYNVDHQMSILIFWFYFHEWYSFLIKNRVIQKLTWTLNFNFDEFMLFYKTSLFQGYVWKPQWDQN